MAAAFALFIIALGAIARFAITDQVNGVDLEVLGTILMVCGVVGLLLAIVRMVMDQDRGGPPAKQ
ncbi:MAG: DUF6458 family protein [Solirubrobacterales bacterium]|nr:DUF6458 family protein [Solirubrobacterales bacterium]